eukprot:TRINITY_DN5847_c0_g1_i5.p1 TRINITY_DN5847_c0_g1~~TRINITY_DN5847_c0_g1_i5.p1  ORF type:complete len:159 (-),score=33.63 TRINITY_DN5847_c0_g1_i5:56-532(-)
MSQVKVGDKIPEHTFKSLIDGELKELTTDDVFKGKTVALFAVPGAFTPGCSKTHCPSFVNNHKLLTDKGVNTVACTAVNDAFVLEAWGRDQNAKGFVMLADGDCSFAQKMGLTRATGNFGGLRSERYGLIAVDGVIKYLGVDAGEIKDSTAEALLSNL